MWIRTGQPIEDLGGSVRSGHDENVFRLDLNERVGCEEYHFVYHVNGLGRLDQTRGDAQIADLNITIELAARGCLIFGRESGGGGGGGGGGEFVSG